MFRSQTPNGSNRKRERSPKRPPIATILLLVVFLLTILAFITLRQQQTTEDQKLRLLAGLASQVETALPDRAGRMIDVIQGQCELSAIRRYLEELPDVTLVYPGPSDSGVEAELGRSAVSAPAVSLEAVGNRVYVSYFGPAFVGSAAIVPRRDGEPPPKQGLCDEGTQVDDARLLASLDLHHVVEPIIIPEAFDTMLIADRNGEVLFQRGSRELRLNDVSRLLEQVDKDAGLFGLGHLFGVEAPADPENPGGLHTVVDSVRLANSDYRLFLQPIAISLPALPGEQAPRPADWMAIGLVSEERLLSASFTTSPLLLFLLVAVFPAALVSWPFLKLRYISPRQRFHRLDAVALIFATLFGTSLAAFLLFDGLFVARLNSEVDHHLETLSESLRRNFRFELFDAYHQLLAVELDSNFEADAPDLPAVRSLLEERFALPGGECRESGRSVAEHDDARLAPAYPYFHSLFWVDSNGGQHDKLSLRRYALLTNYVPERKYFTRLYDRDAGEKAETFPHRGQQRFALSMSSDAECTAYLLSRAKDEWSKDELAEWMAEGRTRVCTETARAAFSPLRSMTSGEDLLVVSITSQPQPVAVLYGKPVSLGFPVLPDGYGFAVLDSDGRVLFHSDPRRSLNENFLKAVDRSALLGSLVGSQRSAHLVANYWGQRHRMHVAPLSDLPWSLVVFRHSRDLRMRNFELTYDFANPFLLYTLLLNLFVMALILVLHRWYLHKFLWPGARFGSAYRFLSLYCLLAILGTAAAVAWVDAGLLPVSLLVWLAFLVPFSTLAFATLALACAGRLSGWVKANRSLQKRFERRLLLFSGLLGLAILLPYLGHLAGRLRAPSLLPAGLVVAVVVWALTWSRRRHSFEGRRRMKAYISTLTCVIFVLAILPAVVLFEAAASRQVQLLVQETQIQQAQAIQQQEERLQDARDEIDCPSFFTAYEPVVRALRSDYLSSVFATERPPASMARMDETTTRSGLWHHHCAEDDGSRPGLAQRLVSARPFPLNDLSSATTGVDLSRHPRHGCSWSASTPEGLGAPVLTGKLPNVWGAPMTLRSALFEPLSFERLGLPFWIGFPIACLLVFLMPRWLSNVIARKVLLVPLASVERGRIQEILHHAATKEVEDESDLSAPHLEKPTKILLVTSVPDLALDTLAEEKLGNHDLDSLYQVFTLDRLVDEFGSKVEEKHQASHLVDFRQAARRQEGDRSVLLVRFTPDLKSPAVAERQIEALKYVAEDERRTLVILSRFSIHALREEADALDRRADKAVDRRLLRRWIAFLGSFVVRYGKDVTEAQEDAFRTAVEAKSRDAVGLEASPAEVREHLALLDLIYRDCSITRHLQYVGYEILSEINFESATQVQVLNQIAFLARPYYQAIWENCSTDERVVLAQLALDGLVNPDNLGWVLDLMQKGLVQREKSENDLQREQLALPLPGRWNRLAETHGFGWLGRWLAAVWPTEPAPSTALRLMNRSFARFVRQQVERVQLMEWEEEEGTSTWSVLRWLLPIPLLLLGGFLFITQRDAVSNMVGVLVAVASLTPTLVTVFDHFRHLADRRALAERRRGGNDDED